jgi:hypothetical protein
MVTDAISSKEYRPSDELRSDLMTAWLEIPLREGAGPKPPSWDAFSKRLDRCFRHVSLYVGQRVTDPKRFRQIVTDVLAGSLDLFITPCDEREELRRLTASADRILSIRTPAAPGDASHPYAADQSVRAAYSDKYETAEESS